MLFLIIIYILNTLQGIVNTEPLPDTHDQANVEPLRNEISTDAAKADPGVDSSSQKQGDS